MRRKKVSTAITLVFIVGLVVIAVAWLLDRGRSLGFLEAKFNFAKADAIVDSILDGTLQPDESGILVLVEGQELAHQGTITVTNDAGTMYIFFPTWRGKGANLRGYVYSTGQAPSGQRSKIRIEIPWWRTMPPGPPTMAVDVDVLDNPRSNWYYVSYAYD